MRSIYCVPLRYELCLNEALSSALMIGSKILIAIRLKRLLLFTSYEATPAARNDGSCGGGGFSDSTLFAYFE
jgi:hypothetical protein